MFLMIFSLSLDLNMDNASIMSSCLDEFLISSYETDLIRFRFLRFSMAKQANPSFSGPRRGLVVLVHYAITLEVDGSGIANDTLDFISLQNNLVEKNYPGNAEQPTVVYTITDFRNYITEALHKDNFLTNNSLETPGDPLQLENGTTPHILLQVL